jgi:hypothetical protein
MTTVFPYCKAYEFLQLTLRRADLPDFLASEEFCLQRFPVLQVGRESDLSSVYVSPDIGGRARPSLKGSEICQGDGTVLFFLCLPRLLFLGFASFGDVVFRIGVGRWGMFFYLEVFAFLGVWGVSLGVCRDIP